MTDKEYNERKELIFELMDAYEEWWECTEDYDGELYAKYQRLLNEVIERMK